MGCFTDRYLLHLGTFKEVFSLRKFLRNNPEPTPYYLEQQKRAFLLKLACSYSFKHVVSNKSVYKSYADFFVVPVQELENIPFDQDREGIKVLIIPDARQAKRRISNEIIGKIRIAFEAKKAIFETAVFSKNMDATDSNVRVYQDFAGLVQLIAEADLIIGGDSLPIHIAQMLGKPHYILYPKGVRDQFFTPFAMKHHTYFTFDDIIARKSFLPE